MAFCLVLFAILLSFKYFPGIENSGYYAGFVMNAIHPDLMSKDPIVGGAVSATHSPYKLTIYYLFPKLLGEIWLDDRFIAVLYILAVIATFWTADRIAVALGADGIAERLTILALFLKDHVLLENAVNFAHPPDFHHSAIAMPIGLWLINAAVRGAGVSILLAWGALLTLVSLQIAPFALGMALIAQASLAGRRERGLIASLLGLGLIAAAYGLFVRNAIPDPDRIALWNMLVFDWYEGMVIPFDPRFSSVTEIFIGNGFLAVFFGAVLFAPTAEHGPSLTRARAIIAIAVVVWFGLGLFVQFAPDALKYPQILLFPVTRQLQFPQVLAYIALSVIVFRWLDRRATPPTVFIAAVAFFLLFIAGPGNFNTWIMLSTASVAVALTAYFLLIHRIPASALALFDATGSSCPLAASFRRILLLSIAMVMAVAMAMAVWQKAPAWVHLIKTGIHGTSGNAIWTGVDAYIRAYTEKDAVVLAFRFAAEHEPSPGKESNKRLIPSRNIVSRSGRATPIPMMLSKGLNLEHFQFAMDQQRIGNDIAEAWMIGNAPAVTALIDTLNPRPDYVIVPTAVANRVAGADFPYARKTEIRNFAILARVR